MGPMTFEEFTAYAEDYIHKDYAQIKDFLRIRLRNAEKCRDILPRIPHRIIADLALTYSLTVELPDRHVMGAIVTTDMIGDYGVTPEQLHSDALQSSMQHMPSEMTWLYEKDMLILTNTGRIQGASVIAYPGTLEQAAAMLDGSFYLLPSSVHEVILLRDSPDRDYHALEIVIRQINRTQVDPREQLSDHAYYYDAETHRLMRADQRA